MYVVLFVVQLGRGYVDGVYFMVKDFNLLDYFVSGSGDGVVKVWELIGRDEMWYMIVYEYIVKDMEWIRDKKFFICVVDRIIKFFDFYYIFSEFVFIFLWIGKGVFISFFYYCLKNVFVVVLDVIFIYDFDC